jgi:hypothetical protein
LKAEDPEGDQVQFEIQVTQEDRTKTFTTDWVASGMEVAYTVPSNQALFAGRWSWKARAIDKKGAVGEWSEEVRTFIVQVPKPDLVPKGLTMSSRIVEPGEQVTVRFQILNQGQDRAEESKTRLRLSLSDEQPSANDPLLDEFTTPALGPNQSVSYEREVTIPLDISSGDYHLWVIADADGAIEESEETNDWMRISLKVNRRPLAPTLLSPEDGVTVSSTPTFKIKAEDPDGDKVRFKIEILRDGEVVRVFDQTQSTEGWGQVEYASGEEASFTVPSDRALREGTWRWRAMAVDSQSLESDWSNPHSLAVGPDTNGDGGIDDFELLNYIEAWARGEVRDFDLLGAIERWANRGKS